MKKFLISLIVGMTMMAIGATLTVFEVKDYEFVNIRNTKDFQDIAFKNHTFTIKDGEKFNLIFNQYVLNQSYEWEYDDSMKDDMIHVSISNNVQYTVNENAITIEENNYDDDYRSLNNGMDSFNKFIEGLKKHKIYTYHDSANIVITGNQFARNKLEISTKE